MELHFEGDRKAVAKLAHSQASFERWFGELDDEHVKLGSPYGVGSLAKTTGVECWIAAFLDDLTPEEALAEDMANAQL